MSDVTLGPGTPAPPSFAPYDFLLYAAVVALWGTSWIALHMQLGVVAPGGVDLLALCHRGGLMMLWVLATRQRLRFGWRDHLALRLWADAVLGAISCSSTMAASRRPPGLLAVVFSLASVFNILLGALVFGRGPSPGIFAAAVLGFARRRAMFSPQIVGSNFSAAGLRRPPVLRMPARYSFASAT